MTRAKGASLSIQKRHRSSCERVCERAAKWAQKQPGGHIAIDRALSGLEGLPRDILIGSFIEPRLEGARVVRRGVTRQLEVDGSVAFALAITPANIVTPLEDFALNTLPLRKVRSDFKKAGLENAFGLMKFWTRPSGIPRRYEVYPVIEAILYGTGLDQRTLPDLQRRLETRFDARGASVMKFRPIASPKELSKAAAGLFGLADAKHENGDTKSWRKSRGLRDYRRLQALASVPLKQLCLSIGDGDRLLEKVIVEGKHFVKLACKATAPVIHRDEIPVFMAAELVRLGLTDHRLPFIRVR